MKLAVNYSPEASALLAAGQIELDYFKTPGWDWMVAEARRQRPVAVHFDLRAGTGRLGETDWAVIEDFMAQTGTPYVNLHLYTDVSDFPGFPVDLQDGWRRAAVIDRLRRDVEAVVQRFGAERVIVENVPYLGPQGRTLRPAGEPAVIRQIIETAGCGLLLDLSHARMGARWLGMDEREYIEQLPVARTRELHFTGLHQRNGGWADHLPALPDDWVELDWALGRVRDGAWGQPWLLAFEYGGVGDFFSANSDAQVIAEQVPTLHQRLIDL